MTLRVATPDDATAVTVLERATFGLDAWSEASVRDELTGPGRRAVVAVDADELMGYAVTLAAGDVVDLQRIAVRADRRRQGLARALLDALVDQAVRDGAVRMMLEVSADNDAALAFYANEGFEEISRRRRYYRDGTDAVVMQRRWEPATGDGRE